MEEKIKVIEEEVGAEKSQGALKDLSQKELEDKMAATRDELEEAKSNKEFAKCSDLQVKYPRHLQHYDIYDIYDTTALVPHLRRQCSETTETRCAQEGSHKVRATTKTIKTREAQAVRPHRARETNYSTFVGNPAREIDLTRRPKQRR